MSTDQKAYREALEAGLAEYVDGESRGMTPHDLFVVAFNRGFNHGKTQAGELAEQAIIDAAREGGRQAAEETLAHPEVVYSAKPISGYTLAADGVAAENMEKVIGEIRDLFATWSPAMKAAWQGDQWPTVLGAAHVPNGKDSQFGDH